MISTVAVVTCSRPALAVRRTIEQIRNARASGRALEICVADDTRSATERQRLRDRLRRLARHSGATLRYVGLEEKVSFAQALAKECGLSPALVEFALIGRGAPKESCTTGANRNAVLLQTSGTFAASFDDDIIAVPSLRRPSLTPGLAFDSTPFARIVESFESRETALASLRSDGVDPLALHESLLGKKLRVLMEETSSLRLSSASPSLRAALLATAAPHAVRVTSLGHAGDCGMRWPAYAFVQDGMARERILRSEDSYRTALASREVTCAVAMTTVLERPQLMAGAIAFDGTSPLPPFFPFGRNEDGLFARVLEHCHPTGACADLPWLVVHAPPVARCFNGDEILDPSPRLCDLIAVLIGTCGGDLGGAERSLARLGALILERTSGPVSELVSALTEAWRADVRAHADHLEQLLDRYGRNPSYWAKDVVHVVDRFRSYEPRFEDLFPGDPLPLERLRHSVRSFGELLCAWPALLAGANTLAKRGYGLAAPP
jgi:hypothetical protein